MVLLIDNYDSFVFNLARYVTELGVETRVIRNDELTVAEVRALKPEAVILSPGPCTPQESGICIDVIRELGAEIPMLGVCLGHQAIGFALGASVVESSRPVHGRTSLVTHHQSDLFEGLPNPLRVGRYHSLVVVPASLPDALEVTAQTVDGIVMAVRHRDWPLYGVQFHPESVLTEQGHRLLANFLRLAGLKPGDAPEAEAASPAPEWDFFAQSIAPDATAAF